MKAFILLLALSYTVTSAIFGSTIYTLSRFFQYKIEITSQNGSMVQFATIAPTINHCVIGRCFYGWIDNSTLGGQADQSISQQNDAKSHLFFIELLQNSTFQLISNNQLDSRAKNAVDITAQLLTPFAFMFSNAGLKNDTQLYHFVPLDNNTANEMTVASLVSQDYNFASLVDSFQASNPFIGWNKLEPASDVIIYDKGLNCLMGRQLHLSNGINIKVEMVSKAIYGDLTSYSNQIVSLSNTSGNVATQLIEEISKFSAAKITSFLN